MRLGYFLIFKLPRLQYFITIKFKPSLNDIGKLINVRGRVQYLTYGLNLRAV